MLSRIQWERTTNINSNWLFKFKRDNFTFDKPYGRQGASDRQISLAHMSIFTTSSPHLSATFSLNAPEYVDTAEQKADLYLNGSTPIEFVLDGMAARASSFTTLLKVLELTP